MKKTIAILPFLLFCFCFSYSQRQNVTLRLLKEDADVDSLMNIVVKDKSSPDICFSFTTISLPHGYGFLVLRLTKTRSDLYYRVLPPPTTFVTTVILNSEDTPFLCRLTASRLYFSVGPLW
jgi:hypothetical protein